MNVAIVQATVPVANDSSVSTMQRASSRGDATVRGLGVTFSGELVVACEVALGSAELTVEVEFPEDVRGLLAIASWGRACGVTDAVTAIAVAYLASLFASDGGDRSAALAGSDGQPVVPRRVQLSMVYVRVALGDLSSKGVGSPTKRTGESDVRGGVS